jgi:hypothetical protein
MSACSTKKQHVSTQNETTVSTTTITNFHKTAHEVEEMTPD